MTPRDQGILLRYGLGSPIRYYLALYNIAQRHRASPDGRAGCGRYRRTAGGTVTTVMADAVFEPDTVFEEA